MKTAVDLDERWYSKMPIAVALSAALLFFGFRYFSAVTIENWIGPFPSEWVRFSCETVKHPFLSEECAILRASGQFAAADYSQEPGRMAFEMVLAVAAATILSLAVLLVTLALALLASGPTGAKRQVTKLFDFRTSDQETKLNRLSWMSIAILLISLLPIGRSYVETAKDILVRGGLYLLSIFAMYSLLSTAGLALIDWVKERRRRELT